MKLVLGLVLFMGLAMADEPTLEQRVQALEAKVPSCSLVTSYYGRFYGYCPLGTFTQEVQVQTQIVTPQTTITHVYLTCYKPEVVCR